MRLLVSVMDAVEAVEAVQGGAHLIDVKNPREGALGAALPHVIRMVREAVPAGLMVSAALGDMPFLPGTAALAAVGAGLSGADLVKVGLYGVRTPRQATTLLHAVAYALRACDCPTALIACAYADAAEHGCLPPDQLPEVAARAGCAGAMIDTRSKDGRSLFDHMTPARVTAFLEQCRQRQLLGALAGALTGEALQLAAALRPDVVGVRSAACTGGDRAAGRVTGAAVSEVVRLLHTEPSEVH
ncbi:MAG TPA: (5-formylfuran-3-yl)methyl phosphate synthase [Symbiobacteriaceae bacterium]|nr:(5-formylfuran-3-yl)methyl phosphate synthase [Symbiobacteriaceae bacterium]